MEENNINGFNSEKTEDSFGFIVDESVAEILPESTKNDESDKVKKEVFEWLDVLVTALVAVVLIFSLVFRIATIDGTSMLNTLNNGDKVIVVDCGYTPKRGDIVVVSRNIENSVRAEKTSELPIIKRIIALGGDTVNIDFDTGIVYVNGEKIDEPYIRMPTTQKKDIDFPVYVPEGYIFVMGDNRENSLDSRSSYIGENGMIHSRYILGRAVFRVFPFDKIGGLD